MRSHQLSKMGEPDIQAISLKQRRWFSRQLLDWFEFHGRKDLPWQINPTPYRVWVSEIMLQQTQVNTVIPYYRRFMDRFPNVSSLAAAEVDEVLYYWSGLGYYARGRNLHRTARIIQDRYHTVFPMTVEQLETLPGIGLSTAAAILALSANQCRTILDGNVKRVLSRFHAVEGWPGNSTVSRKLWDIAKQYTPKKDVSSYTQAIMDLGATICTRHSPGCNDCPLKTQCLAHQQQREKVFPMPRPRKTLPVRQTTMLILSNEHNEFLLEKRPPSGVWGGLWSFPEYRGHNTDTQIIESFCDTRFDSKTEVTKTWPVMRHTFSHFHLEITPVQARILSHQGKIMDDETLVWYNADAGDQKGMAAPVKKLLDRL